MFFGIRERVQEIAYNTQFCELPYAKLNFVLASLEFRIPNLMIHELIWWSDHPRFRVTEPDPRSICNEKLVREIVIYLVSIITILVFRFSESLLFLATYCLLMSWIRDQQYHVCNTDRALRTITLKVRTCLLLLPDLPFCVLERETRDLGECQTFEGWIRYRSWMVWVSLSVVAFPL
jgi:hypothetical protein